MYCRIIVNGVVQGIGFRPFIYNIAVKNGLKGQVLNLGDAGVEIIVVGSEKSIEAFIDDIHKRKPVLAHYEEIKIIKKINQDLEKKFTSFSIIKSSTKKTGGLSFLPPDLPICEKCLAEIRSTDPRRKNYSFTSCVDCGPRFTVIKSLPYDRPTTTMDEFEFCDECLKEYTNPVDRRFHAQTTCCWNCGPHYYLLDKSGEVIINKNDFRDQWITVAKLLDEGNIIAIKGIGGTHLASKTTSVEVIDRLRRGKGFRGNKPFAIMAPTIEAVKSFALVDEAETNLLTSYIRPIVLLTKKTPFILADNISPNLHNIGVMLPYSGIHHLLTESVSDPALIMTSGNPSNVPMLIDNTKIVKQLDNIADYFLLHNRQIWQRCDDSVVRVHKVTEGNTTKSYPMIIRRSRGYVPVPLMLPVSFEDKKVLGLGAEMYNVPAIGIKNRCFPTQYIGHMDYLENVDFMNDALTHFKNIFGIDHLSAVACDLHPEFSTTKLAKQISEEENIPYYQFQHHYAHLSALAIDNKIDPEEDLVVAVLDGTGYGSDGNIWGGEVLAGNYETFQRLGHLEYQFLFGGDSSVKEPHRFLLPLLAKANSSEKDPLYQLKTIPWLKELFNRPEITFLNHQINKITNGQQPSNYVLTSSTGRILDAISILLGASKFRTFEGEPALRLEALAEKSDQVGRLMEPLKLPVDTNNNIEILNTTVLLSDLLEKVLNNEKVSRLAYWAEKTIAVNIAKLTLRVAEQEGITNIGISGGVCYNRVIFSEFKRVIQQAGKNYRFLFHKNVPCGDGAVGIGQVGLLLSKVR